MIREATTIDKLIDGFVHVYGMKWRKKRLRSGLEISLINVHLVHSSIPQSKKHQTHNQRNYTQAA